MNEINTNQIKEQFEELKKTEKNKDILSSANENKIYNRINNVLNEIQKYQDSSLSEADKKVFKGLKEFLSNQIEEAQKIENTVKETEKKKFSEIILNLFSDKEFFEKGGIIFDKNESPQFKEKSPEKQLQILLLTKEYIDILLTRDENKGNIELQEKQKQMNEKIVIIEKEFSEIKKIIDENLKIPEETATECEIFKKQLINAASEIKDPSIKERVIYHLQNNINTPGDVLKLTAIIVAGGISAAFLIAGSIGLSVTAVAAIMPMVANFSKLGIDIVNIKFIKLLDTIDKFPRIQGILTGTGLFPKLSNNPNIEKWRNITKVIDNLFDFDDFLPISNKIKEYAYEISNGSHNKKLVSSKATL